MQKRAESKILILILHFRTYMNTNLKAINQPQPVRWNGCPINFLHEYYYPWANGYCQNPKSNFHFSYLAPIMYLFSGSTPLAIID